MNKQGMIAAAMLATVCVASPALADHERGYRNEPNFGGVFRLYFGDIVPHRVVVPRRHYYQQEHVHFQGCGHAFGHQKHHWRAKHRGHHWRGHHDDDRRGHHDDDWDDDRHDH